LRHPGNCFYRAQVGAQEVETLLFGGILRMPQPRAVLFFSSPTAGPGITEPRPQVWITAIRTDKRAPWASTAKAGWPDLAVWWALRIVPERNEGGV